MERSKKEKRRDMGLLEELTLVVLRHKPQAIEAYDALGEALKIVQGVENAKNREKSEVCGSDALRGVLDAEPRRQVDRQLVEKAYKG